MMEKSIKTKSKNPRRGGVLLAVERLFGVVGVVLTGVYLVAQAHAAFAQQADLRALTQVQPDQSTWSQGRIEAYEQARQSGAGAALAVLRIPSLELVVPIRRGTDAITLNRAAGLIEGTARPGEPGNMGIAGHRDGFFRGLKDLQIGALIQVDTTNDTDLYRVDDLFIVQPDAVDVLDATDTPTLTLVTCYPFYFVGKAPQRFIVQASLVESDASH